MFDERRKWHYSIFHANQQNIVIIRLIQCQSTKESLESHFPSPSSVRKRIEFPIKYEHPVRLFKINPMLLCVT